MSIGIDFILRARTAMFTQGLASANNAVKDLKKSIRDFDVGGGFKQALGVGGVIAGFRMAITNAQELRDEARKTGKAVDESIESVARYGDALASIGSKAKNALTEGLSFFTKMGDAARRYFQDVTKEQEDAAQKMVETTGKAADEAEKRLKASREANSPEKVAAAREKADKAERESQTKGTAAQKKLVDLINERADLEEKIGKLGKGTTEYQNVRARIAENERDTKEATADFDKDAAEAAEKKKKAAEKISDASKKLVNKFAPTVEQLAAQETGGFVSQDDPRIKARQALKQEGIARALFERGDAKGGLAAAQKAQGLREGLEGRASDTGALTPKAAEDAFSNALKETNTKLEDLEKAVAGVIKAQK